MPNPTDNHPSATPLTESLTTSVTSVITPNQFRDNLKAQGITLKSWAIARGFDNEYCSRVLCGLVKGNRGKGHTIAVAMGIKAKPQPHNV